MSNLAKNENSGEAKEVKKAIKATTLVTKPSQSAGIQKSSKATSNRAVLGAKDTNKKSSNSDLKRTASGSGVLSGVHKKRSTGSGVSQPSTKETTSPVVEVEVTQDDISVEVEKHIEIKETIKLDEPCIPPPQPQGWNALVNECREFMPLFVSVQDKSPAFVW